MHELIQITSREMSQGSQNETVNARELWEFVESKRQFANWVTERIESYGYQEGVDFTVNKFVNGRATQIDYYITVAVAKELAMVENNEKGREVRRYFIECERLAKAKSAVPTEAELAKSLEDPAFLRKMLLSNVEKVIALESTVAAQAPKVAALDRIATVSEGAMSVTDAAKSLQIPPKKLFDWMEQNDWLYRRQGGKGLIAYQTRIKQAYLEHKIITIDRGSEPEKIVTQAKVTAKGLAYLASVFCRSQLQFD